MIVSDAGENCELFLTVMLHIFITYLWSILCYIAT